MKFFDKRKKSITVAVILFMLIIFANLYIVRKAARDGLELYFYDKLLVAYHIGGMNGLNTELNYVSAHSRIQKELKLVKDFKKNQENNKDAEGFLKKITDKKRKAIKHARVMREAAFGFIIVFLLLRVFVSRSK